MVYHDSLEIWDPLRKIHWSDKSRFLLHMDDQGFEAQEYGPNTKVHQANCPLEMRLGNGLGCIAQDWKLDLVTTQDNFAGISTPEIIWNQLLSPISTTTHPPRYISWWMITPDRIVPRQFPDNMLWWLSDHGFRSESAGAHLGHPLGSYTGTGSSCTESVWIGTGFASGVVAVAPSAGPTSDSGERTHGHPVTWRVYSRLNLLAAGVILGLEATFLTKKTTWHRLHT